MLFAHIVRWIFVTLWSTLAIHRALNVGTQSIPRVAVAEGDSVFCPRCQGGRRDHVDVGWFQRMCHINGVEWPESWQVTGVLCMDSMRTVLQFLVATKRSMLVASLSLSMLVERDAHSACNHCASLLSLLFSRQLLFSMDTQ